jgi:hypothetical protein
MPAKSTDIAMSKRRDVSRNCPPTTKEIGHLVAARLREEKQFESRKAIVEDLLSKNWDINEPLDKDTPPVMRLFRMLKPYHTMLT